MQDPLPGMFHLYYDTRLNRLADSLAEQLAQRAPARLLEPQVVLVPQPGLRQWLVQRMAERQGIAANLEFIAPAQLVWRMLRAEHPGLPAVSGFDREVLRWRILAELRSDTLPPELRELAGREPDGARGLERAGHLAHLFERYQGYRRELLEAWAAGAEADDPQAQLWRRLVRDGAVPRSRLLGTFLKRHADPSATPPAGLPERLFAFGIVNVSPDVLRALGVIGRHSELHFFLPTPCREYWGDVPDRRERQARLDAGESFFDEPPNRLLVSLGGVGRDFVARLFAYDEVLPDTEDTAADDAEPPRGSLLERVQADVITLAAPDPQARRDAPDPQDRSLQVHVCHSPLREVQVLHDQLLDRLQSDPGLQPRDIAVMVPDLGRYAPCIEAVFGAMAANDPRRIPWTVADRPQTDAHALVTLFQRLLELPATRLTASEVLEVMAVPAVLRSFGLDEDVLATLAARIHEAGIRWGEDAGDRVAQGLPAFEDYSWRFGRRRLLLGYMCGDVAAGTLLDDIAPQTDIEGADSVALGALFALQRQLRGWREELRQPRAPAAWQALLNDALDRLVPQTDGRDEERALDIARMALRALADHSAAAGFDQALDWQTVRAFVREQLDEDPPQQRFLSGGVSVCGLVPLRNVPFKLICILGLDADAFPRRDPADALNRMLAGKRLPGDRSVREDDRYLFLQTMMAAERQLYLSYTGIDMRRGTAIEPSVVLSEVLEHVCEGYFADPEAARKALVTRHPMQPFAPRLFLPSGDARCDARVFTYREEWLDAARPGARRMAPEPFLDAPWPVQAGGEAVELAELDRFLRNPAAYFLRRQAGITLNTDGVQVDEREPLTLGPIEQGRLDRALAGQSGNGDTRQALEVLRAQALLPPLVWGRAAFETTRQALEPGLRQMQAWREAHPPWPPRVFRLGLGPGRELQGVLDGLHEGGYATWVGSSHQGKGWLSWWLDALVAVAMEHPGPCLAWGRDTDKSTWALPWQPAMPAASVARQLLAALVDLYREGLREPLPLPPRTAYAWAVKHVESGKDEDALKSAVTSWEGGFNGYAERTEPWFALAFRDRDLLGDEALRARFIGLSTQVYGPLCAALQGGRAP